MQRWLPAYVGVGSNLSTIPRSRCARALAALAGLPESLVRGELAAVSHARLRHGGAAGVRQRRRRPAHAAVRPRICSRTCARSNESSGASRRANAGVRASSTSTCSWSGRETRATDTLTLPHPGIAERDFVLYPLARHRAGSRRAGPRPRRCAARARAGSRNRAAVSAADADDASGAASREALPRALSPDMPAQRYIVVEGPIGVGKTSLARRLAETLEAELVLEQDAQNPFLERFYRNPQGGRVARAALLPVPARAAARQRSSSRTCSRRAASPTTCSRRTGCSLAHAGRGRDVAVRAGGLAARGRSAEAGSRGLPAGAGGNAAAAHRETRHRLRERASTRAYLVAAQRCLCALLSRVRPRAAADRERGEHRSGQNQADYDELVAPSDA